MKGERTVRLTREEADLALGALGLVVLARLGTDESRRRCAELAGKLSTPTYRR